MDALLKKYQPMTETAFYILYALTEPRHGYGIIKFIEDVTSGRLLLGSGTIYGTISKMQKDGLIQHYSDEERKTLYEITALGQRILAQEIARIEEMHRLISQSREEKQ